MQRMINSSVALGMVFVMLSCGKNGTSNSDNSSVSIQDDLVVPNIAEKQSSLTLYKKSTNDSSLYLASGLGGLGIENGIDKLDIYPGIPIQTNSNFSTNVSINVKNSSDFECRNIFSYSPNSSQVKINANNINKALKCDVNLNLKATNIKTGQEIEKINDLKIRINLTMKAYMYNNDPNYLKFSGQQYPDDSKIREIVENISRTKNIEIKNLTLDNLNFLEGAKNHITSLKINNSNIKNYDILSEFKNLDDIELVNLNLDNEKAKQILSLLPQLKRLSVENNNITDLRIIMDTQPNLVYLNLSGNKLTNLRLVRGFKNLESITLKRINLSTLAEINGFTNLKELDISENPLRKFTDADTGYLSSLKNLEALNVSVDRDNPNSTPISDNVLNEYFRSLVIDSRPQTLKKFIARNRWEKKSKDCNMINNFNETVGAINLLKNIEYLDLHGNGCVDTSWGVGMFSGLTQLPLMNYSNLKYLNISDTPARSFLSSIDWRNPNITFIFNETPWNYDTGVFMTKENCLSTFPYGNKNRLQCNGLDPNLRSN